MLAPSEKKYVINVIISLEKNILNIVDDGKILGVPFIFKKIKFELLYNCNFVNGEK